MAERLQKLIAAAGLASRRHAEEMIAAGEVTINGEVVTTRGTRVDPERDHIKVRGRLINPLLQSRTNVYVLLNKPRGYLASLADPEGALWLTISCRRRSDASIRSGDWISHGRPAAAHQ